MQNPGLDKLRLITLAAVGLAAAVSFVMMLHVGGYRMNVLMLLFSVWDLSPFVALVVAGIVSKPWPDLMRVALGLVTTVIAAASPIVYVFVAVRRPAQPAFAFLVVPLGSWVLLIVTVLIAHVVSTRRSGHQTLFGG
jgi:hypothetical protein